MSSPLSSIPWWLVPSPRLRDKPPQLKLNHAHPGAELGFGNWGAIGKVCSMRRHK